MQPIQKAIPLLISCALLAAGAVSIPTPANAIKGDNARFKTCKQLESRGNLNWYGIATGTEDDTFAVFEFNRSFHTKACFTTQKACNKWVKRIWWEIPTMDELHNAWCKPR